MHGVQVYSTVRVQVWRNPNKNLNTRHTCAEREKRGERLKRTFFGLAQCLYILYI